MTVFNESAHAGEFLLSEANGYRSRKTITLASGAGLVKPGAVLGKVTTSGKYLVSAIGAVDGSQTAVAVAFSEGDATSADETIVAIVRDAEVNTNDLTYHADRDLASEKTSANDDLAAVGIIVR